MPRGFASEHRLHFKLSFKSKEISDALSFFISIIIFYLQTVSITTDFKLFNLKVTIQVIFQLKYNQRCCIFPSIIPVFNFCFLRKRNSTLTTFSLRRLSLGVSVIASGVNLGPPGPQSCQIPETRIAVTIQLMRGGLEKLGVRSRLCSLLHRNLPQTALCEELFLLLLCF